MSEIIKVGNKIPLVGGKAIKSSGGITPTGSISITDTNVTDVTNYATAQVVDADLVAENIKKDVNILGIVGTYEGGGGGGLPNIFQEVTYIRSDGGQYIDTGVKGGNYKIVIDFKFEKSANDIAAFGILTSTNGTGYFLVFFNGKWYFGRGADAQGNSAGVSVLTRQTVIMTDANGQIVQNDNVIGTISNNAETTKTITLFARYFATENSVRNHSSMSLYSWKVYDKSTNELIQDLVPCYRKRDGVVGLYDLVNAVFLTNKGTGTFIAGADVN